MREPAARFLMYGLAVTVFAVDRLTKWIIETRVSAFDNLVVIPGFFEIVHSQNKGAAFGLFSESTSEWRSVLLIGFSVVALVALTVMLWRTSRFDRKTAVALALILGGALGNVFDRVRLGTVTDFLLFYIGSYQWPAFNAADSAIVIGSGLLLLDFLRMKRQPARSEHVS
ncbi:MAG TPA: signal peptidase II [Bryobacteraceae bacterium]|nr:signal peptidase II [Bryobacteraceae bacterium]